MLEETSADRFYESVYKRLKSRGVPITAALYWSIFLCWSSGKTADQAADRIAQENP